MLWGLLSCLAPVEHVLGTVVLSCFCRTCSGTVVLSCFCRTCFIYFLDPFGNFLVGMSCCFPQRKTSCCRMGLPLYLLILTLLGFLQTFCVFSVSVCSKIAAIVYAFFFFFYFPFPTCMMFFVVVFLLEFPEGRPGMSDVPFLYGISGPSFDSPFLSPLLFFLPGPLALSVLSFFCDPVWLTLKSNYYYYYYLLEFLITAFKK